LRGKSETIRIRRASLKDLGVLVEQRRKMFEDIRHRSPMMHEKADRTYRKWVTDMSRRKRFQGFLAMNSNGEPIAGGCVWIRDAQPHPGADQRLKVPYLLSMYTEPGYRGKGIATLIVKKAMLWSRRRGYKLMTLHASRMGRPVYSKLGWERTWEMRVNLNKHGRTSPLRM
jgi:GNAT superfamily N-acetyltransferase